MEGAGELIVGYTPAFRATSEWRHVYRQARHARDGGVARRVVFNNIENPHRRVLVDVTEYPDPAEALRKLKATRDDVNFDVTPGPARLGTGSFAHPEGEARSLYFCRSNLMIWVYSCGRAPVAVMPWAEQILYDLDAEEQQSTEPGSDLMLKVAHQPTSAAQPFELKVTSRWESGEWAWRKFKATGGSLARVIDSDSLLFWLAAGSPQASVTGWAIEPGRPTYAGRFAPRR